MTGAPRGATCRAMKDTVCLVLGGHDLSDIMAQGMQDQGANGKAMVEQRKKMIQISWSSQVSPRFPRAHSICISLSFSLNYLCLLSILLRTKLTQRLAGCFALAKYAHDISLCLCGN